MKTASPRRAEWIWRPRELAPYKFLDAEPPYAAEQNRYVYFRKTLDLPQVPSRADVLVSADGRYQLWVNGRLVGRGPARSHPSWQCADPYDLAPFFSAGGNVIAALVHSYGRATSWYELPGGEAARVFGCGGFFLQGDSGDSRLDTNGSWRCLVSEAWEREVPFGSLGFEERYDARQAPEGWREREFEDSSWAQAQALRVPGLNGSSDVVPFPLLVIRDIPPLRERFRAPHAIADVGNGNLVLDFGEVVAGYPRLALSGPDGAVVELVSGEELEENGRVRPTPGIPGFDPPRTHRYVLRAGEQTWERFGWEGFRYLQVRLPGAQPAQLLPASGVTESGYPVHQRGRFHSSDELLNRIWEAGARTVRRCMHDAFVDCPSREQRQWAGDACVEALVAYAAFGDTLLARRFLVEVARSQRADGLTAMCAPGDFSSSDFCNIPDFCLSWITAAERYVDYSGDVTVVEEIYPAVARALGWFARHLGDNGLLADLPHWLFLDWAELDKKGEVTAVNAQFVAALRSASRLAGFVGAAPDSSRFARLGDRVAEAINALLWDEERGVYPDARRETRLSRRVSQHANSAAIAFGVAPQDRWARIFETILDEEWLVLTGRRDRDRSADSFDPEKNVVAVQPYFARHLHRALASAGLQERMLAHIRRRWAPMLDGDNPTFWETWERHAGESRCHGYSAAPTYDLSTETLGVEPLTPGFGRFRVSPHPGGLEWAEGTFPCPAGDIEVAWAWVEGQGSFQLRVVVPPGTEAEVFFPPPPQGKWERIEAEGCPAAPTEGLRLPAGRHRLAAR